MEKRMKQLLIGGIIVIAAAAVLFWFLRMRASYSLSCSDNPSSPACWHAPDKSKIQRG